MPEQTITIVGTLGRDPELRFTSGGQAVANMSVACSHRYQKKGSDDWTEETTWFNVTAWRELAENVASSLVKGNRVIVSGRMQNRKWVTDAGENRYAWDLVADEIGASVRWATAKADQTTRTTAGDEPYSSEEPY
jgi:single-strand DNA-binding protein